ncbi:hypothetical protein KUTeg_023681 [Tegillarca granosa]|uniref:Uncharacterized protein n=1 Tax=Tegillarca granosa TaxID=220873 RepID=A0ABQ9E785_TEGGR|nr:hypothetical protein KUTeg_023681 [Tegillarca granosa]
MILGREGLKISYQIEKKFIGADKHVHKKRTQFSIFMTSPDPNTDITNIKPSGCPICPLIQEIILPIQYLKRDIPRYNDNDINLQQFGCKEVERHYNEISFFMRKRIIAIYAYATNDTYQKERLCVIRISQLLTRLNANIPAATAPNKTHCTVCSQEKEMILTNYTSREVVNLHLNTHVLIQFFNWRLAKSVKNIFLEVFWIVSLVCINQESSKNGHDHKRRSDKNSYPLSYHVETQIACFHLINLAKFRQLHWKCWVKSEAEVESFLYLRNEHLILHEIKLITYSNLNGSC